MSPTLHRCFQHEDLGVAPQTPSPKLNPMTRHPMAAVCVCPVYIRVAHCAQLVFGLRLGGAGTSQRRMACRGLHDLKFSPAMWNFAAFSLRMRRKPCRPNLRGVHARWRARSSRGSRRLSKDKAQCATNFITVAILAQGTTHGPMRSRRPFDQQGSGSNPHGVHIVRGPPNEYVSSWDETHLLGSTTASQSYCNCGLADDGNSGMRNANTSNVDNEVVV